VALLHVRHFPEPVSPKAIQRATFPSRQSVVLSLERICRDLYLSAVRGRAVSDLRPLLERMNRHLELLHQTIT
jgi:hypothetical protein